MSCCSSAVINISPLVTWSVIPVEQNALAGVPCKAFERHRRSSNYNDYAIGCLLLSINDVLKKFNRRSRVINHQFKVKYESQRTFCYCVKELSYPAVKI